MLNHRVSIRAQATKWVRKLRQKTVYLLGSIPVSPLNRHMTAFCLESYCCSLQDITQRKMEISMGIKDIWNYVPQSSINSKYYQDRVFHSLFIDLFFRLSSGNLLIHMVLLFLRRVKKTLQFSLGLLFSPQNLLFVLKGENKYSLLW